MPTKTASAGLRIAKVSLAEQAYDEIRRQILDRRLLPGARLNIDALSRDSGISSSPLREALVRLGAEGLVVFTPNAGFSIAPVPDAQQMRHLMEYRLMVEAHCARAGAERGDPEVLATLKKAADAMAALREKGVTYRLLRAYLDLEQAFHLAIVDSAHNPLISASYREHHTLLFVARLSVVPESSRFGSDESVREHREIIAAFQRRDGLKAAEAVNRHVGAALGRTGAA